MNGVSGTPVYMETQRDRDRKREKGRESQVVDTDFISVTSGLKQLSPVATCSHVKIQKETFPYQGNSRDVKGKRSG